MRGKLAALLFSFIIVVLGQPASIARYGTSLPATCTTGELFVLTSASAGANSYSCTATNTWTLQLPPDAGYRTLAITVDGGGGTLTTGSKGFLVVPFPCTINLWTILADQSGDAVVDVKRSTYAGFPTTTSIVGAGNKPTLSSNQKNQAAPSSWTSTAIVAGDIIEWNVDSTATVTRVQVFLRCSL